MKKIFIFAAIAALALTSCVKNEGAATAVAQDQEVALSSFNLRQTKASTPFDVTKTFECYAKYLAQGKTWAANSADATDFWATTTATIEYKAAADGNDKWINNYSTYYWPKVGTLTFLAWYPKSIAPTTVGVTGLTFAGLTVGAGVDDLLVADISADNASQTTAVPLLFKHVGSKITVKFANDDYGTTHNGSVKEFEIEINTLKIGDGDMVTGGTYVQGTGWTATTGTADYSPITSATNITDKTIGATDNFTYGQAIVPQEQEDIVITYTVTDNNGFQYDGTYTITGAGDWEAAKHYIYNLTFDFTTSAGGTEDDLEIHFTPTVEDWTDVTNDTTL